MQNSHGRTFRRLSGAECSSRGSHARGQRPVLSLPKGLGLTKPSLPFPTMASYCRAVGAATLLSHPVPREQLTTPIARRGQKAVSDGFEPIRMTLRNGPQRREDFA
jgi:hypothetical protein